MLESRVLATANLIIVLVHHAALMQILAVLVRAARTRIEPKTECLTVESSGPLVALTTRVGSFVASVTPRDEGKCAPDPGALAVGAAAGAVGHVLKGSPSMSGRVLSSPLCGFSRPHNLGLK